MNYLSDKVNSFTGDAISGVNEMRRKWKQTKANTSLDEQSTSAIDQDERANTRHNNNNSTTRVGPSQPPPPGLTTTRQRRLANSHYASTMTSGGGRSPLAAGIPFGGDSFTSGPVTPPIGFRTDILPPAPQSVTTQEPTSVVVVGRGASGEETAEHNRPERPPRAAKNQLQPRGDSSESLYEADAWARLWFPRVMILCLLRMLLFIRKVYEDFHATKVYNLTGQTDFLMISALTLVLPTLVFTLYRVSRYLQLVLPDIRLARKAAPQQSTGREDEGDEAQLTRALMTSSPESVTSAPVGQPRLATPTGGEDGLVTARQSPEAEFHDSQQEPTRPVAVDSSGEISVPAKTVPAPVKLESVNVDKLGDLPDKDTVRVVVGASEQFLHGILFVFWQLKRQVDVMGYLVERACLWRKPAEREKEELARLRTGSDGLEWFQDFYAAFLAILAQVYMLSAYAGSTAGANHTLSAAATSGARPPNDGAADPVSNVARLFSSLYANQTLVATGAGGSGRDVLLVSELVVSSAVIVSLLICVRRRDDGPLTLGLSMLGWGSLFAARIMAIALGFVHLGWRLMSALVVLHVLAIAAWIYGIALASHNDSPSERLDEADWDPEAAERPSTSAEGGELELKESSAATAKVTQQQQQHRETSSWSLAEHLALLSQITILFAVPSLFYWPIMFNLKLHLRTFKYLVLILIQNFLLIPAIWFAIKRGEFTHEVAHELYTRPTPGQLYLLGSVGACSVVGFIFISLYVACKPSLTEYFARADELFNEADQSGIYYEFCSRVFKMADLSKQTFRRLMDQSEELVEERYELVRESLVSRSA